MGEAHRTQGATPFRVRAYISACSLTAVAVIYTAFRYDTHFNWRAAVGFGLLCILAEQFTVTMPLGNTYSVTFVLVIAAIIVAGPPEAALANAAALATLSDFRRPLHRHVFNASQLGLTAALAGLVYIALGGPVGVVSGNFVTLLAPLIACTATNFLVNTTLVSGVIALSEGRSITEVWRTQYARLGRTYVGFALLGLLLAVLYIEMGWASVLFLLMPLLVARHAFQAAINMQTAYDATVRSLIHTIEAKDPYTRGHAERVSRLAEMVARAYGLPEDRCRAIRYAALMHDVGKLGVLSTILQKPGKLTPEEYEHMKLHPLRGVEIVGEIELLAEALVGVRHHHERYDGQGYPDGLAGEEIPLLARLITVSDAFDSMTSTRTYRRAMSIEQGLAEMHRCAGTQFDPVALAALERALERHGWEPVPEGPPAQQVPQPATETQKAQSTSEVRDARVAGL